ncbi:MAG: hypothetical protein F4000_06395 [Holophagales bacterium]|nr:hypothetical protein [Holophagales bacterium]
MGILLSHPVESRPEFGDAGEVALDRFAAPLSQRDVEQGVVLDGLLDAAVHLHLVPRPAGVAVARVRELGRVVVLQPVEVHPQLARPAHRAAALGRAEHDRLAAAALDVEGALVEHRLHLVAAHHGESGLDPREAQGLAHHQRWIPVAPDALHGPHRIDPVAQAGRLGVLDRAPYGLQHQFDRRPGFGRIVGTLKHLCDADQNGSAFRQEKGVPLLRWRCDGCESGQASVALR